MREPLVQRSIVRTLLDQSLFIILLAVAVVITLFGSGFAWNYYFNDPPIKAISLDVEPEEVLCPGDHFDSHATIHVSKDMFLYTYFSVMNEGLDYNLPNTQTALLPRPQPHAATFYEELEWIVPELPPGVFQRLMTLRGYNNYEKPLFVPVKFRIGEKCNEGH